MFSAKNTKPGNFYHIVGSIRFCFFFQKMADKRTKREEPIQAKTSVEDESDYLLRLPAPVIAAAEKVCSTIDAEHVRVNTPRVNLLNTAKVLRVANANRLNDGQLCAAIHEQLQKVYTKSTLPGKQQCRNFQPIYYYLKFLPSYHKTNGGLVV
jgi:hypothetical protein